MDTHINLKVLALAGGNHAEVARILGYKDRRSVWPWTNDLKPFPTNHCVTLEQYFNRAVLRQEMRPHDFWLHWPDLAHLKPVTPTAEPQKESV